MPTSIDFPSVRAGIAAVISTIPEIKRVNPYPGYGVSANDTPCAEIIRGSIVGPGISVSGEEVGDEGLGQYSHLITWTIQVWATIQNQSDAQAKDDLYAARLLDAFNGNRLLDPNGPGVVDSSRLLVITPLEQTEDDRTLWVTEATLQTKIISSL